jgi:DegV family protein with EDD domain
MSDVPSQALRKAMADGGAAVAAWSEVLDRINVFPVPDGDTGRNLVLSFSPLRDSSVSDDVLVEKLLLSARGNSGNIGCAFVRTLLDGAAGATLAERCGVGAERARRAVSNPQPGTMLTVLDALAETARGGLVATSVPALLLRLATVVQATKDVQESLRHAQVVDSGALGMLVFLDGTLRSFFGLAADAADDGLATSFQSLARFDRKTAAHAERGFCVDAVLRLPAGTDVPDRRLASIGTEVVALREGDLWKVHLHAANAESARTALSQMGEVLAWSWDNLEEQSAESPSVAAEGEVHVVTDGAASVSRRQAEALGVTLLDSHVDLGDRSLPETRLDPDDVYRAMRRGVRVSTAQASTHERQLCYQRLSAQWKHVLYLCVGSVYTGNCAVARAWCSEHARDGHMTVLDSGAASGRLAAVVRAAALKAKSGLDVGALASFAESALGRAEEYIFLERLEYLARGGRLSKTGAWFGDALGLAPVVSPFADGARKVALLRKPEARLDFACERVKKSFAGFLPGYVLIEHTDNRRWVEREVLPRLKEVAPKATIEIGPLSLTTGVHTGPGTWAVAFLPDATI